VSSEPNDLLAANRAWAGATEAREPGFFTRLARQQSPRYMWIGCADSRVPANELVSLLPGELFVHRNIANVVVHTDLNCLSVPQYAIEILGVRHIIVCGHYGCGGVRAALDRHSFGIINKWLRNIKDVYRLYQKEIESLPTEEERLNRLIELNIKEQVLHLAETSIIQQAWKKFGRPHLHGWVYDLHDGIIRPMSSMPPNSPLEHLIYEYDNLDQ